jgi:hypothetical protein
VVAVVVKAQLVQVVILAARAMAVLVQQFIHHGDLQQQLVKM